MNYHGIPVKCDDCDRVIGTSSIAISESIFCLGCSEKRARITKDRIENELQPKYYCRACKTFDSDMKIDVMTHIIDTHKEIRFADAKRYIGVIQ